MRKHEEEFVNEEQLQLYNPWGEKNSLNPVFGAVTLYVGD